MVHRPLVNVKIGVAGLSWARNSIKICAIRKQVLIRYSFECCCKAAVKHDHSTTNDGLEN